MSRAYLTIDDGPTKLTPAMIDYLNKKGITPIMFFLGNRFKENYEEAIYALQKGAIVGNHSFSHPSFSKISYDQGIHEIEQQEVLLEQLYQDAKVERQYKLFRFPYGDRGGANEMKFQNYLQSRAFNRVDDRKIEFDWYLHYGFSKNVDVFWTFDFCDYQLRNNSGFTMENIIAKIHNNKPETGAVLLEENSNHIVLMHDHEESMEVVNDYYKIILDYAIEKGVEFITPRFFM